MGRTAASLAARPLAALGRWACLGLLGLAAADEPDVFDVPSMLRAAIEKTNGPATEVAAINEECVTASASAGWRADFEKSIQSMLLKTRRTMQQGLSGVGTSMITLVDACSCGSSVPSLQRFKEQATRLRVLATSHGGLASLDSKVKYEPLKALSVGGIDIHASLNLLIVGWQLQKGPDTVGQALAVFLAQFSDEGDEPASPPAPLPTLSPAPVGNGKGQKQSPLFWSKVLNEAFVRLGDASRPISEACISAGVADRYGTELESSFRTMMQKTKKGMHGGMKNLASETLKLLDASEGVCSWLKDSLGAKRLRSAASRLSVLSSAKTLMQHGANVEYEAMKVLKIGGIDVHLEVNRFIGDWIHDRPGHELGNSLADFFEDFKEEQEPEDTTTPQAASPMFSMVRDALVAAQAGKVEQFDLDASCFPPSATEPFVEELESAVASMLHKRKRTMQVGLKEIADATDKLMAGQEAKCVNSPGAQLIWKAARKLKKLTRRTVVDYGAHIQYEAMKSLTVGGVAVHAEVNSFIAAWKLRSRPESGTPFGELMLRLSDVRGSDEL